MSAVDDLIDECESFLAGDNQRNAASLLTKIIGAIADDIPTYKEGLKLYKAKLLQHSSYANEDAVDDLNTVVAKLKMLRDKREHEMNIEKLRAAQRGATVVIKDVGNSAAAASASASASATLSSAVTLLDQCSLTDDEKRAIKAALLDLEAEDRSKPDRVCEKASKVLQLVKDVAEAAKAVAPFVSGILSSIC